MEPIVNDLMVINGQSVSADKYKVGVKRHHVDIINDDGDLIYTEWHSGKRPECRVFNNLTCTERV